MNFSLTTPATPRSEFLAFPSLLASDLDFVNHRSKPTRAPRKTGHHIRPNARATSQNDQAQIALGEVIRSLSLSKSCDEFVARRDRLFPRYADLMLGMGRILSALTDRTELLSKTKAQLDAGVKFFTAANEQVCPAHLKDQALFSLWELGKVVDLVDFINSRPLTIDKREEDLRLAGNCSVALLFGRLHLDCLGFGVSTGHHFGDEIQELLSDGMRHIVNGHIAARFGARLRQEFVEQDTVELVPVDEEDYLHLAHSMAGQFEDDY